MLYARAAGDVARRIAPDVLAGVPYSAEEIELADVATVTVTRENKPRTVTRQPPPAVEEPPMDDAAPEPATRAQITRLNVTMKEMGIEDRETKLAWLSDQIGRVIASSKEMTKDEASRVLDRLENPEPPEPGWVA